MPARNVQFYTALTTVAHNYNRAEDSVMDPRKQQDARARQTVSDDYVRRAQAVDLNPPSDEEEQFLKSIERTGGDYNPEVIVGGPRTIPR